jgi:hypothetical protein
VRSLFDILSVKLLLLVGSGIELSAKVSGNCRCSTPIEVWNCQDGQR